MTAQARISTKGQVVIPKAVRDRQRFLPGDVIDVVETADGVLLRRTEERDRLTLDQALARIRSIIRYEGPALSIDEMNDAIRQASAEAVLKSHSARD